MDSGELLDLLGNANRRRILRLLARKPCYVTEISEYIGVSPKAVIDHLRKLESAGLIESRVDEQRRKYFYIPQGFRLEVSVSPYEYGAKSAYPASSGLDLDSCQHLSVDIEPNDGGDLDELVTDLRELERLRNELSLAQRWVQGRLTDVMEELGERIDGGDDRLVVEILLALTDGAATPRRLSRQVDAPPGLVVEILRVLETQTVVERDGDRWRLVER
ncbi:Transcriptional regulator, ArsR family [Halapricum desulfuricans]|uniref:Transcriptional regulator, ArsR family n=1 Tax=Halapricum desulfuricans TaxID=2841257 RepID=A0A897NKL5_9EURY|nr:ArsR family transcriptional regulator [Halapricum desulfuricans]QSG10806.1 Transcriptional regulator, ArsR family [Halapricum desulfuricans]